MAPIKEPDSSLGSVLQCHSEDENMPLWIAMATYHCTYAISPLYELPIDFHIEFKVLSVICKALYGRDLQPLGGGPLPAHCPFGTGLHNCQASMRTQAAPLV